MTWRFARKFRHNAALATMLLAATAAGALALPSDEEIDFNTLAGTYLAARTADAEKDTSNAAAFYSAALDEDPGNLFLLERAMVLSAASGDIDGAIDFAGQLIEHSDANPVARLVMGVDAIHSQNYDAAITTLEASGEGVLADLTTALMLAWAQFGAGDTDAALAGLAGLEGEEWYEPFKLLHSGYIAMAADRTEEALGFFEEAQKTDPNAVRITEAYARALAKLGRQDEAVAALEEFLKSYPDNALASRALDEIAAGEGTVQPVTMPVQGASEALAGLGAAVGQEGGIEVAYLYLRLSLHLSESAAGGLAALSLGNLLDTNGQSEAAIEVFESIAPDQPFRALGALRTALTLDRMDRTEEAEAAFREAMRRAPEDVQTYVSYGNMLRGRERFAEAAEIYTRAIDRIENPRAADWSLFYFRGIAHERIQAWDRAEADFRKALELEPDQPLVMNYLGYSWVDKGMNLAEALELIRKAVELRPNDGYIVDSLGWAYYRMGRYNDAVQELERAVSLRSDDPVIHDHLGDAYWKAGRTLEAQFQWRHARDFGAEGEELELILKKIAERRLIEDQRADASLYTVQPGDSLWTISAALLSSDDAYQRLLEANRDRIQSPDQIYPGMQLRIPGNI